MGGCRFADEDLLNVASHSNCPYTRLSDTHQFSVVTPGCQSRIQFAAAASNVLTVKPGISLDFETERSFTCQLKVLDVPAASKGPAKQSLSTYASIVALHTTICNSVLFTLYTCTGATLLMRASFTWLHDLCACTFLK